MGGKKRSKHDGSCLTRTCRFSKTAKRTFNILLSFPFLFFFFWLRFGYTVYWKCCVCVWVPAEKRAKNEQSTGSNRMWTYKLEKREREREIKCLQQKTIRKTIFPRRHARYTKSGETSCARTTPSRSIYWSFSSFFVDIILCVRYYWQPLSFPSYRRMMIRNHLENILMNSVCLTRSTILGEVLSVQ